MARKDWLGEVSLNQDTNPKGTKGRAVVVFTGNRAEYGQLYPVIRSMAAHPALSVGHYMNDIASSTVVLLCFG